MPLSVTRRHFVRTAAAAVAGAPFIGRGAEPDGFEIGLVADAQYADIEPSPTRFYRQAISRLTEAVEHCNGRDLAFCVHLGDLIDRTWASFDEILKPLGRSRHKWHQLLGNHDFSVLDDFKARVPARLGMAWKYGSFDHGNFRFVVLDTNDLSTYAHAANTPERTAAEGMLAELVAAQLPQAQTWNGGVGRTQVRWLERTCAEARAAGRQVIIFSHHPVWPENQHNVWNARELVQFAARTRNVVAWINGHNHAGNFGEMLGLPFVTMHGMVETPNTTAFATARILSDRMLITGHGREPSRELVFRKG